MNSEQRARELHACARYERAAVLRKHDTRGQLSTKPHVLAGTWQKAHWNAASPPPGVN